MSMPVLRCAFETKLPPTFTFFFVAIAQRVDPMGSWFHHTVR